jgi:hypothetical protein
MLDIKFKDVLVSHSNDKTQVQGVWKQEVEQNIRYHWAKRT